MKVKLVGKNLEDIIPLLATYGFETADQNPELLIAHGGDGTLLTAEREFPGIPKLPLRDSRTAPLCRKHAYARQLSDFSRGLTASSKLLKLSGICGEREISGINDVFIHNLERIRAMRYRVWIDEQLYANEIVGDSVGMATPHGSTAYYRSITHSIFRVGLGLAFSNSTELVNHLVLPETAVVRIRIVRGPAEVVADNSPEVVRLDKNDEVLIRKSENMAVIHGIDNFMCQECRLLRHPNRHPVDCRHVKPGKRR